MEREPDLTCEPVEVFVDAGRLPPRVGEDGAVWDPIECPFARHEGHDRGLHTSAETDNREGRIRCCHSFPWASLPDCVSFPSLRSLASLARLNSRVNSLLSRSSASGPVLNVTFPILGSGDWPRLTPVPSRFPAPRKAPSSTVPPVSRETHPECRRTLILKGQCHSWENPAVRSLRRVHR